ncbi:MAG: hypothetical protein AAFW60_01865 [Pseudomonadota bacterium]
MTMQPSAYSGPVEALTLDEAAVRLRMTRQWLEQHYDGPRIKLGRETRISAAHLHAWLDEQAGLVLASPRVKKGRLVDVG